MKLQRLIPGLFTAFVIGVTSSCSNMNSFTTSDDNSSEVEIAKNTKKYVLDNGLTVIISSNKRLPIVSYYTLFDVGGRYEGEGTTGATHFLEHMMFKGAKKYGPGEFESIIEHNGGNSNAYTTNDMTVYHENVPSHLLEKIMDVESDRLSHLLLEPVSFESERKVVFEERKMRYENSPDGQMYLTMMKKIFAGTPYGQSVIGEVTDLEKLTRDQMMSFFKKFYAPNNAIVAIVGDVDQEAALAMIKKYYGALPAYSELNKIKNELDSDMRFEFKSTPGMEYRYFSTTPLPKVSFSYRSHRIGVEKNYALDVLAHMLSDGMSSYFYKKYIGIEDPVFSSLAANHYNLRFSGVFYLDADLSEGKSVDTARDLILKDSAGFCKEALDENALQKTKNAILTSTFHTMKSNASIASTFVLNEKFYGDFSYAKNEMNKYLGVNLSEVRAVCKEIFIDQKPIVIALWNQFPKKEVATSIKMPETK